MHKRLPHLFGLLFTAGFMLAMGLAVYGGDGGGDQQVRPAARPAASASAAAEGSAATPTLPHRAVSPDYPSDDLQRSLRLNTFQHVAKSGVEYGKTLFYYKCWMCHNEYTIASNPGQAPPLEGIFKKATMITGQAVNDENVGDFIMNGGPRMPSYKTEMTREELRDLLAYMKTDECCTVEDNPPPNPWYTAETRKWSVPTGVKGGPTGLVKSSVGPEDSTEGIMVQLIAPNNVRTTVYANEDGRFEFPAMQAGEYTLRIAKPLEYKPYKRESVKISGATKLPDIVLEPLVDFRPLPNRAQHEGLPPVMQIQAQLSNDELLWNLPGTADDKDRFQRACGSGCHSYIPMFRARYDERSWGLIVDRMFNHGGQTLRNRQNQSQNPGAGTNRGSKEDQQKLVKWLAQVRGPESVDAPYQTFPRPRGRATRAVVTEYEIPRELLGLHDVSGDSQGNIWFTSHKANYWGKLDPKTGIVTGYTMPPHTGEPGCRDSRAKPPVECMPGTHRVLVDQKHGDTVWVTEPWGDRVAKLNPKTGAMKYFPYPAAFHNNFSIDPNGFLYGVGGEGGVSTLSKMDPETGATVQTYTARGSYDSAVSRDGKYWAGGGPSTGGNYGQLVDLQTGKHILLTTGLRMASPSRGGWDADGNAWFGGKNGSLVRYDTKTMKMREFFPPLLYSDFYEALPDRNGEVWAGLLHGRGYLRYNPRTDQWVEYALPEPFGHNRRAWIDETTNPVTVWYPDYQGYIVRIQPLD